MSIPAVTPGSLRTCMRAVSPDVIASLDSAKHMLTRPSGIPASFGGTDCMLALTPDVSTPFGSTKRMLALTPNVSAALNCAVCRKGRCGRGNGRGRDRSGGRSRRIGGRPMMPAGPRAGGQRNKRIQAGNAQTDFLHRKLLLQKMFHPKQFCAPRFYFIR